MRKFIALFVMLFIFLIAFSQPETSSWDGVSYCIKDHLKNHLKDSKSLKIQDAYELVDLGEDYIQRVTYRAKNSFGGYVIEDKVFFMHKVSGERRDYKVYDVWDYETFQAYLKMLTE